MRVKCDYLGYLETSVLYSNREGRFQINTLKTHSSAYYTCVFGVNGKEGPENIFWCFRCSLDTQQPFKVSPTSHTFIPISTYS